MVACDNKKCDVKIYHEVLGHDRSYVEEVAVSHLPSK